jgi:uncharacterized repeat protein (TIGR01451 family)
MKHSHLPPASWQWLAAAGLLLASANGLQSQIVVAENEYNRQYRSFHDVPLGENYTGRSPFLRPKGEPEAPAPAPVQMVRPPERPPVQQSCAEITSGLVHMTKKMPAEVSLGQEFMYELNPVAVGCVGNVVITDRIPPGASYVRSEPPAEVQGDRLIWRFPEMEPGEARNIKVWLKAEQEGRLTSCATVYAEPRVCASTIVGKPVLAIVKSGPEMAQIGTDVTYTIVVSNTGSAVAREITVTDAVPEGLSHSSGQRQLSFNVGDLAPNQSRSIPVTLRADARGRVCNGAVAASSNAGEVRAEACTTIVQPGLKIVKSTEDRELLINRVATYAIVVSNIGDVPLTGVVVTDNAAPETSIVAAEGGTASGNTATWNVGELKPGEEKQLSVKIQSSRPGRFCNTATVATAQGLRESAQACSDWIGVTGVLVEVVDDPDPIQVGETTTFTIRVTNQGSTRDIEDLNVKAVFGEAMDPTAASGGATVNQRTVSWPTVPRLAPKQSVTYTIVGKAARAGDHRLETQVTTRERANPIVELESTTIY